MAAASGGYIERRFDSSLRSTMAELIASVEVETDGSIGFTRFPSNPLFRQPLSGWYWQISSNGQLLHQSSSSDQSRRVSLTDLNDATGGDENWIEFEDVRILKPTSSNSAARCSS